MLGETSSQTAGYAFLSILTGAVYALVSLAVPTLHATEAAAGARVTRRAALWRTSRGALFIAFLTIIPVTLAIIRYPASVLHAFVDVPNHLQLWKESIRQEWLTSLKARF